MANLLGIGILVVGLLAVHQFDSASSLPTEESQVVKRDTNEVMGPRGVLIKLIGGLFPTLTSEAQQLIDNLLDSLIDLLQKIKQRIKDELTAAAAGGGSGAAVDTDAAGGADGAVDGAADGADGAVDGAADGAVDGGAGNE